MPEKRPYHALENFRPLSRPDLGTVRAGTVVPLDPDHARRINRGFLRAVDTPAERHTVGKHLGGGWYPVLRGSETVDKVKGKAAAERRAAELDAGVTE